MKIILHGSLKNKYPEMIIEADTAAEAIEGWSRQCDISPMERPVIDVLGFETEEALYSPTKVKTLHLYPSMYGGGGKFGQIIVGAVLIVAAIVIAPWNPMVALALLSVGIGMVVGGVMQLFMKTPSVSKSDDPDPSRYLANNGMTTQIGTLIPKGYGRYLIGGHYLSIQVNSNDMVYGTFPTTVP